MMTKKDLKINDGIETEVPDRFSIIQPDDWHCHFREGEMMRLVLPCTARTFARAIAMPNLSNPLTEVASCLRYFDEITTVAADDLKPLMTLYLYDRTTVATIAKAKPDPEKYDRIFGAKLYPQGATTGAEHGVGDIKKLYPVFEEMQRRALPLLLHGESTEANVDFYDREKRFIEKTLAPLHRDFPALKIVLEHITTQEAVNFVCSASNVAATITPHHLLYNRSAMFEGGLRPHRHCLPPAQRESHRESLVEAATSGAECFFAGTDSAPHATENKHCDHGCAGIFNAPVALETYAEIFDRQGALDKLEAFTSINGAGFYGVARNRRHLTLMKRPWRVPETIEAGGLRLVPFRAGETVPWQVAEQASGQERKAP